MKKYANNYSIGLDIGTGSVGWACINEDYNLLEFRNRKALGVHLFNSADTAEARRLQRGMRRRYNRRIKRLQMLQEIFRPVIKDENFFSDIASDHKWKNNNDFEQNTLSETLIKLGYTREKIHNEFPTIYHLRDFLIKTNEAQDMKLIYLAIHNLVKSRGHFLLGVNSWEDRDSESEKEGLEEFLYKLYELNEIDEKLDHSTIEKITKFINNNSETNKDKAREVQKLLPKNLKDVGSLLVGLKSNLYNVFFNCDNYDELKEEKVFIKISEDNDETDLSLLTEEQNEIIEIAKIIFMDVTLKEVLKDEDYVAAAKVNDFKKNKRQLKILKKFIKENYGEEVYKKFFVTSKATMELYKNKPDSAHLAKLSYFDQYRLNKKPDKSKKFGKERFFSELEKLLKKKLSEQSQEDTRTYILEQVQDASYLALLNNVSNSSIPYQNSLYEAKRILSNQARFNSDISEEVIDKVIQLISFRIPYYIGPLVKNDEQSEFAWSERLKDTNITPFNFDEVIDRSASAEKFIRRMTNKCSYLLSEDVLPKHSLLYQEMEVRNELNGISIRGNLEVDAELFRIPIELRNFIFENHFKNTKKVTLKNFKEFLKKTTTGYENKEVFGTQKEHEFASSLSSYIDFKNIFGQEKLDNHLEEVEYMISWLTIFNEKSIIREKIEDNFDFITQDELEKILELNYSGWGRLSKKALTLNSNDSSIIELMREKDCNFIKALNSEIHGFKDLFDEMNRAQRSKGNKITLQEINELKSSPALKKSIWSTIRIVEELVDTFGEPKNIVLEFAREEGEKKRPVEWSNYWESVKKDNQLMEKEEFKTMFTDIDEYKARNDLNYKLEKLKLYLLQGGKCLYTLERINLKELMGQSEKGHHNNYYDIDHILPRNFVKDDSLDNKVLVIKDANNRKSGYKMPLSIAGNKKGALIGYWNLLVENKMMTKSKLFKLMKEEFTDVDKEKFIARQLVETRQISVHVRNLLEERFDHGDEKNKINIEVLRAGIVSEVRRKLDFPKIRPLNDYHHAVDALLVAGIYQYGEAIMPNLFKFNMHKQKAKDKWRQVKENKGEKKKFNEELFLATSMKNKEIRDNKTFQDIFREIINVESPITTKKVGNNDSSFYDQSILSPKVMSEVKYQSEKNNKYIHTTVTKSHGVFISYFIKNKKGDLIQKTSIVDATNIEVAQNEFDNDYNIALFYAKKDSGSNEIVDPRLLLILKKGDLIYINENPFYFASTKELTNAKQLKISLEQQIKLKTQLNKWKYDVEEAKKVYRELALEIIDQYIHILPSTPGVLSKRKDKILKYFETTEMTFENFESSVNEVLKVSSPSATRSKDLGGRYETSANKIIEEGRYASTSITGLKYKKPKRLIKFLED